jgi:PadR family transcriptional regulator PadR
LNESQQPSLVVFRHYELHHCHAVLLTINGGAHQLPLIINRSVVRVSQQKKSEALQGALDLMILQSLESLGPLHGWGVARRIEQVSGDVLFLNQGTIYPALVHLEQQGWIKSEWGVSENNRKAKFFRITKAGPRQLAKEVDNWWRIAETISRLLPKPE